MTLQALPSPDVWSVESRGSGELVFSFSTHRELQVYNLGANTGAGVMTYEFHWYHLISQTCIHRPNMQVLKQFLNAETFGQNGWKSIVLSDEHFPY